MTNDEDDSEDEGNGVKATLLLFRSSFAFVLGLIFLLIPSTDLETGRPWYFWIGSGLAAFALGTSSPDDHVDASERVSPDSCRTQASTTAASRRLRYFSIRPNKDPISARGLAERCPGLWQVTIPEENAQGSFTPHGARSGHPVGVSRGIPEESGLSTSPTTATGGWATEGQHLFVKE